MSINRTLLTGLGAGAGIAAILALAAVMPGEPVTEGLQIVDAKDTRTVSAVGAELTEAVAMLEEIHGAVTDAGMNGMYTELAPELVLEAGKSVLDGNNPESALSQGKVGELCDVFDDVLETHQDLTNAFLISGAAGTDEDSVEFNRKHAGYALTVSDVRPDNHPCGSREQPLHIPFR